MRSANYTVSKTQSYGQNTVGPFWGYTVYYTVVRCLSVRLTPASIASKWLTLSSNFFHAHHCSFSIQKIMAIFGRSPSNGGVECRWGIKIAIFDQHIALFRKWYKIGPLLFVTMERQYESIILLSNGAIYF